MKCHVSKIELDLSVRLLNLSFCLFSDMSHVHSELTRSNIDFFPINDVIEKVRPPPILPPLY